MSTWIDTVVTHGWIQTSDSTIGENNLSKLFLGFNNTSGPFNSPHLTLPKFCTGFILSQVSARYGTKKCCDVNQNKSSFFSTRDIYQVNGTRIGVNLMANHNW